MDDKYHGLGIYKFKNDDLYKGEFKEGKPVEGIMQYSTGEEYTGDFGPSFIMHGYGCFKFAEGAGFYQGEFN